MRSKKGNRDWKRAIYESAVVKELKHYRSVDRRFASGLLGRGVSKENRDAIRRACLIAREESSFFGMGRRIAQFLLRGSVGSYGSLLLLSSLFGLMGQLAFGKFSVSSVGFVVCVTVLASSVFLLHSGKSLAYALEESLLGSWLFFTVCHLPRDRFGDSHCGEERPWLTLLCSLLGGALVVLFHPLVLFLLALFVLLFLLVQSTPELLFCILLFLLPFLNLFAHPTQILLALLLIGEIFWLGKVLCGHRVCKFGLLEMMVLLFAVLMFLGGIFGASGWISFLKGSMLTVLLLSYFPMVGFFSRSIWRRRGFAMISTAAFVCSVIGIFQYVLGMAELRWVDTSRFSDIGGRVTSLFRNPNVLGVYLLLTLPVALGGAFLSEKRTRFRLFYAIVAVVELICLVLTWSRGAWLGAIIELGAFFLLCSKSTRRILMWSMLVIVIWLPLLPHSVRNRFASIGTLGESSIRYRFYTWRGSLRMLKSRPFGIGIGEEAFCAAYRSFAVSGTETVTHAHNLFLQIALELGAVGLIAFLAVLFFALWAIVGILLHRRGRRDIGHSALCGLCALLGTLTMGFFDYVWYHYGLFWLFFVMLAMATSDVAHMGERMENEGVVLIE